MDFLTLMLKLLNKFLAWALPPKKIPPPINRQERRASQSIARRQPHLEKAKEDNASK